MELPLEITAQAWEKIQAIRTQKQISTDYALRLGMRGSGCSGHFFLGFDTPKAEDTLFDWLGEKIIINKAQLLYFYTIRLEWVENAQGGGLKIFNDWIEPKNLSRY